jgi:ligand-binding sensor domain-containing protein
MGVADAWVTYTTQDGLAGNKIRGLAVQGDTVWAATDAGISRFLAGSWTTSLGAVEGRDIMVNGGEVWCATSSGVRRFSATAWSVLNAGLATSDCRALAADAQNTVWVGLGSKDGRESHGSGFAGWRGSAWQGYTSDGLPDNAVVNIAFEASGRVWVSTAYGGVGVWDGTSWTNFTSGDGLARDVYLYGLAVDRFNRKWFGTWGAGVSRLEDRGTADKGDDLWTTLTPGNSGLSGIHVPVIFVDSHGDLYFGSQGPPLWTPYPGAVDRLSSDTLTWSHYDLREQGAWNVVKSIAESRDGLLWFGIENYGVLRLDDGGTPTQPGDDSWESFTTEDGLVDNTVWVITPDPVAGMWFGTNNGVSLYRDLSFTNLTRAQGLPGEVVRGVAVDSQGDVYFGLIGGGLSRYDPVNRSWAFYNSGNSSLVFDDVGAINIRAHDERRDELWIATDRGLSRLVLPNPSPSSPSEARVCPNPFLPGRGDREIVFSDVPDNSVLRIYGLAAELVRRIGLVDVRRHTMSWDGRNESGRPVASGMYLYVVSSPQGERLGKLCIIR